MCSVAILAPPRPGRQHPLPRATLLTELNHLSPDDSNHDRTAGLASSRSLERRTAQLAGSNPQCTGPKKLLPLLIGSLQRISQQQGLNVSSPQIARILSSTKCSMPWVVDTVIGPTGSQEWNNAKDLKYRMPIHQPLVRLRTIYTNASLIPSRLFSSFLFHSLCLPMCHRLSDLTLPVIGPLKPIRERAIIYHRLSDLTGVGQNKRSMLHDGLVQRHAGH